MSARRSKNPYKKNSLAFALHEIGAGRRVMPESEARKHHIVPQFLLARWATPVSKEGSLSRLSTGLGEPERVGVQDAAFGRDFYAVQSTESDRDNRIEVLLGLCETYAARSIAKLLEKPQNIDAYDQIDIALFLTMQTRRTRGAQQRIEALIQSTAEQVLIAELSDPARFARGMAEFGSDLQGEELEDGRVRLIESIRNGGLKGANLKEEGWTLIIDTWLDAAEEPLQMRWLLLRPQDGEFVTSDAGFAYAQGPEGEKEIYFPIAPDACLMLISEEGATGIFAIPREDVNQINRRIYEFADEVILGRTDDVVMEVRRYTERHHAHMPPA